MVDVLLQELDSIGADNSGVLISAATNVPWDIDEAMLRPGRFDRSIFVPPPDAEARTEIVELLLAEIHAHDVDTKRIARDTPLFSGADLRSAVQVATDELIEVALDTGTEPSLETVHLETATRATRPSTLDWLNRVKVYVEFANSSERYSDVASYLKHRDVRRRLAAES